MNIAEKYVEGLKEAYLDVGAQEEWGHFEEIVHGAFEQDIQELKGLFPDVPESLIQLLEIVDGTCHREYAGEKVALYFLGSDVGEGEYPYYLLSARQMMKQNDTEWLEDYVEREFEEVSVDDKIIDDSEKMCWLHFSDCMNNGGSSQLFIDFSPSATGKKGQIVRFLHDPDELLVIADSFEDYLRMLMDEEYPFINEDIL